MPLTDETRAAAREIIARYPEGRSRSALLPMLHLVQAEEGCVTQEGVAFCASELGITAAEVSAVATFYTMYKRHPVGDWLVSVCTNLSCALLGGDDVYARLSKQLAGQRRLDHATAPEAARSLFPGPAEADSDVVAPPEASGSQSGHDQTTEDGSITLEHAECLAACDYAPVMTVNYEFFDQVDPDSAQEIVEALQRGERPMPTRGAPLCTFAQASRQLAGFTDPTSEGVAGPGVGEPSVAGVLLAEAAGWSAEDGVVGASNVPDAPGLQTTPTGGK